MNFRETDFDEVNWNDAVQNEVHCVNPVVTEIDFWLR
jgi:hypothetical protein